MRWNDIPTAGRMTMGAIVAILAVMGYLSTYQTDAEAQAYQEQHATELVQSRIQQIDALISQYRFQLLDPSLTEAQKQWLRDEIKTLEDTKKCIRERKC